MTFILTQAHISFFCLHCDSIFIEILHMKYYITVNKSSDFLIN